MTALPTVQQWGIFRIVRDDQTPGGTKARVLPALFNSWPEREFVYAGPAEGYAQIAMGYAAIETGKRATCFVAKRKHRHPRTVEAVIAGANVLEVEHGYLSVVRARARDYCERSGARLLPFGLDTPEILNGIAALAQALGEEPTEVWCAAGSGLLSRSLQKAWPNVPHHAVRVGHPPDVGAATLWLAPETFGQNARVRPPFPSCSNYDAKVWQFFEAEAKPGALFWNVAA